MTDEVGPKSFDNLNQSGLIRIPSKDDRQVSFSIGVFGGSTSFEVFTGQGGRPWKWPIGGRLKSIIRMLLRKMRHDPRECRHPIGLSKFEENNGKKGFVQVGQIGIGIDPTMKIFIDVAANDLQGKHYFLLRQDGKFDLTNVELTEKEILQADIDYLISILDMTDTAERLTSFNRPKMGGGSGGGGWKGGNNSSGGKSWGNNNNGGNRNSYGGNRQGSSTFGGGGVDISDDIPV